MKTRVIKEYYSSLGDLDLRRYYLQITWDEYPIVLKQVHHWKSEFQGEKGEVSSDEVKFYPVSYLYWDYKGRPEVRTFTPQKWYLYHTDDMIPLEGIALTGSFKGYCGKTDWRYFLPKELKELVSEITNRAMEEVEPFEMALLEGDLREYDFAIWEKPYPPMRYSPWR